LQQTHESLGDELKSVMNDHQITATQFFYIIVMSWFSL